MSEATLAINANHISTMRVAAHEVSGRYSQILAGRSFRRALDVGCSSGALLSQISAGSRVGVDCDPGILKIAAVKGIETHCLDLDKDDLPFRAEEFDLIVCNDVLEHLVDPMRLLHEIRLCLSKAGGLFLTHIPNEFRLSSVWRLMQGQGFQNPDYFPGAEHWNYPHLRFYTHSSFKRMLESAGFEVVQDYTIRDRIVWRLGEMFTWGPTFLCKSAP